MGCDDDLLHAIVSDLDEQRSTSENPSNRPQDACKASRANAGKPELSLVPLGLLTGCARVMAFGAKKYSRNNYRKGFTDSSLMDCLLRHAAKYANGEELDDESGLCHLDHVAANIGFLLEQRRVRESGKVCGVEDLINQFPK